MKVLSIRQPWAWLIVHGYKDIENRTWATNYRGDCLIHAGKGMTHDEYDGACALAFQILGCGFDLIPDFDDLPRGGIVGAAKIVDCVRSSVSPWFFGEYGFVLEEAIERPFVPLRGQLGFFETSGLY